MLLIKDNLETWNFRKYYIPIPLKISKSTYNIIHFVIFCCLMSEIILKCTQHIHFYCDIQLFRFLISMLFMTYINYFYFVSCSSLKWHRHMRHIHFHLSVLCLLEVVQTRRFTFPVRQDCYFSFRPHTTFVVTCTFHASIYFYWHKIYHLRKGCVQTKLYLNTVMSRVDF